MIGPKLACITSMIRGSLLNWQNCTLHNATYEYDSDLRPWYLDIWNTGYGLSTYRFKLKEANSELYTKRYLTNELENERNVHSLRPVRVHSSWEDDCLVFFHNKPDENDWIISVLFNPNSYKIKAENPDNDQVTPVVSLIAYQFMFIVLLMTEFAKSSDIESI